MGERPLNGQERLLSSVSSGEVPPQPRTKDFILHDWRIQSWLTNEGQLNEVALLVSGATKDNLPFGRLEQVADACVVTGVDDAAETGAVLHGVTVEGAGSRRNLVDELVDDVLVCKDVIRGQADLTAVQLLCLLL